MAKPNRQPDKHRSVMWGAQQMDPWYCSGCLRRHGAMVNRTQQLERDGGRSYCDRTDPSVKRFSAT